MQAEILFICGECVEVTMYCRGGEGCIQSFFFKVNNSFIILYLAVYLLSSISFFFHYRHRNDKLQSQTQLYTE